MPGKVQAASHSLILVEVPSSIPFQGQLSNQGNISVKTAAARLPQLLQLQLRQCSYHAFCTITLHKQTAGPQTWPWSVTEGQLVPK